MQTFEKSILAGLADAFERRARQVRHQSYAVLLFAGCLILSAGLVFHFAPQLAQRDVGVDPDAWRAELEQRIADLEQAQANNEIDFYGLVRATANACRDRHYQAAFEDLKS